MSQANDIEIVGIAADGKEAIERTRRLKPDVITMDVEMPIVDGISAVRKIMAEMPTRILMFSALTKEGARETLDALDAGAMDFLPKDMSNLGSGVEEANKLLLERVRAVGQSRLSSVRGALGGRRQHTGRTPMTVSQSGVGGRKPELLAIGASTGGTGGFTPGIECIAAQLSFADHCGGTYAWQFHRCLCGAVEWGMFNQNQRSGRPGLVDCGAVSGRSGRKTAAG